MRARRTIRAPQAARLAVGATVLAFPATAMAVTTATSEPAPPAPVALHGIRSQAVRFGERTVVRGSAPHAAAGTPIVLDYRSAGSSAWQTVARGRVHPDGRFYLSARLRRSGSLQVRPAPASQHPARVSASDGNPANEFLAAQAADGSTAPTGAPATAASATPARTPEVLATPVRRLTVTPEIALSRTAALAVLGSPVRLSGRLLPARHGRRVTLDARIGHRWVAVASTRTGRGGRFSLRYVPSVADGATPLLSVFFSGDRLNGRSRSRAERIALMQYAQVSWYEDAGNTACGFHATYGIASRTLPCGTQVTLSYGGRTVVATVDDRGPFVYSRLYDLNQNVAAALGMYGVATVLASV
ncbi:septal ring lytic transglycosylase RlpA family protein [Conexibacter sp. DBS9H8]|uniref:septal ring lytic transglycosylase RlpA family protein n=1 Tax=Conexibacter sp. DBS9H8 TaxID=2937801 RepID=UPI002010AED4|nr:septal ring lytic transglycosylase RlpA family protein [Conexibacter sp. DBS9H8]